MPTKNPEVWRKANKKWYEANRECYLPLMRARKKQQLREVRLQLLHLLGDRCVRCGESDLLVLQVDHVNNNGSEDRRQNSERCGLYYYKRILKKVLEGSKDYQILCANCNYRKEMLRRL